jgi:DNA-binding transcriptional ArsR family regulator
MATLIEAVCGEAGLAAGRAMVPVSSAAIERASRIFRALGDPARLRLLEFLTRGEACVTEVAEAAGDEISTVSQRLRVLRSEGLVSRRRQGKHILYALADQHVVEMIFNALEHATERRKA